MPFLPCLLELRLILNFKVEHNIQVLPPTPWWPKLGHDHLWQIRLLFRSLQSIHLISLEGMYFCPFILGLAM